MVVEVKVWYNQNSFLKTYKGANLDDPMKEVYHASWDEIFSYPRPEFCDWFFRELNINIPPTWCDRSMSVGDVVQIGNDFYSCQPSGWKTLEG